MFGDIPCLVSTASWTPRSRGLGCVDPACRAPMDSSLEWPESGPPVAPGRVAGPLGPCGVRDRHWIAAGTAFEAGGRVFRIVPAGPGPAPLAAPWNGPSSARQWPSAALTSRGHAAGRRSALLGALRPSVWSFPRCPLGVHTACKQAVSGATRRRRRALTGLVYINWQVIIRRRNIDCHLPGEKSYHDNHALQSTWPGRRGRRACRSSSPLPST